jgi:hypothetical protein
MKSDASRKLKQLSTFSGCLAISLGMIIWTLFLTYLLLFSARSNYLVIGLSFLLPAVLWIGFWFWFRVEMLNEGELTGGCLGLVFAILGFLGVGFAIYLMVARPATLGEANGLLVRDYSPVELSSSIEIKPNAFRNGEAGAIDIQLANVSDDAIELGDIVLRLPADWSKGFVVDYSQSTVPSTITASSQMLGVVGLPGELRYEGRVLAPGEKRTISLRVVANEPGEYSGLRLQMGAKIGEWIYAKVDRSVEAPATVFP